MELNSSSIKISFPFAQFSGSILNLEAVFQGEKFGCDPTHPNLKVEPQCMGGLEDHFPIEYGNKYGFHVKLKECNIIRSTSPGQAAHCRPAVSSNSPSATSAHRTMTSIAAVPRVAGS